MKNLMLLSFVLLSFFSCKKDEESTPSIDLWSGIEETKYYQEEIFNSFFLDAYGKWDIVKIDGGYTGGQHEPNFDYMELRTFGVYGFIRNDTLLEFGKIEIKNQTEQFLQISLKHDSSSQAFFFDLEPELKLFGTDSLVLYSSYMDGYNYYFKRKS